MRLAEASTLFKYFACPPVFTESADTWLANTHALAFIPEFLFIAIIRDANTCAFICVVNLISLAVCNGSVAPARALLRVKIIVV